MKNILLGLIITSSVWAAKNNISTQKMGKIISVNDKKQELLVKVEGRKKAFIVSFKDAGFAFAGDKPQAGKWITFYHKFDR